MTLAYREREVLEAHHLHVHTDLLPDVAGVAAGLTDGGRTRDHTP